MPKKRTVENCSLLPRCPYLQSNLIPHNWITNLVQFLQKHDIEICLAADEPYQTLVKLRYFKELSYEEIAVKKEIPLGTVKAQLFRARALLAELIRKSQTNI